MGGEPKYIKDLRGEIKGVSDSVGRAEDAIIKIETTLTETLPGIKNSLTTLNGTVRKHETDLALQKQAHEECPARQAHIKGSGGDNPANESAWSVAKWGLKQFGIFGAELAVIFALLVLLMRARGLL